MPTQDQLKVAQETLTHARNSIEKAMLATTVDQREDHLCQALLNILKARDLLDLPDPEPLERPIGEKHVGSPGQTICQTASVRITRENNGYLVWAAEESEHLSYYELSWKLVSGPFYSFRTAMDYVVREHKL
jgi:hypothetical protein